MNHGLNGFNRLINTNLKPFEWTQSLEAVEGKSATPRVFDRLEGSNGFHRLIMSELGFLGFIGLKGLRQNIDTLKWTQSLEAVEGKLATPRVFDRLEGSNGFHRLFTVKSI